MCLNATHEEDGDTELIQRSVRTLPARCFVWGQKFRVTARGRSCFRLEEKNEQDASLLHDDLLGLRGPARLWAPRITETHFKRSLSQAALARMPFFFSLRLSCLSKDYSEACNRVPAKSARRVLAVKQQWWICFTFLNTIQQHWMNQPQELCFYKPKKME